MKKNKLHKRPYGFWKLVDWEKSNAQLALECLTSPNTIRGLRHRYAPNTENRLKLKPVFKPYRGPRRDYRFWRSVDWSKPTGQLVLELGASWSLVSMSRRRYAPETVRPQALPSQV